MKAEFRFVVTLTKILSSVGKVALMISRAKDASLESIMAERS